MYRCTSLKVNTCNCKESNYALKSQIKSFKETLRKYELENEVTQPSRNEEKARELVERDIKVVNNRYEIPVPLNMEVVKSLPNNFDYALERTKAVRYSALESKLLRKNSKKLPKLFHNGFAEKIFKQKRPECPFKYGKKCFIWLYVLRYPFIPTNPLLAAMRFISFFSFYFLFFSS